MKLLEKEFERPQGQGMWSVTKKFNNDSQSVKRDLYNVCKYWSTETAQYRLKIIFNCSYFTKHFILFS